MILCGSHFFLHLN